MRSLRPRLIVVLLLGVPVGGAGAQTRPQQPWLDSLSIAVGDDSQPAHLPLLPAGMTIGLIAFGDSVFHGRGHCFACHGSEAQGLPDAGNGFTRGIADRPVEWTSLDSLITMGIPDAETPAPLAMPPRGGRSDLTPDEVLAVAAYVWAISQSRGEPWPGGHHSHIGMIPVGSSKGTNAAFAASRPARPDLSKLHRTGTAENIAPMVVLTWILGGGSLLLLLWLNGMALRKWVLPGKK